MYVHARERTTYMILRTRSLCKTFIIIIVYYTHTLRTIEATAQQRVMYIITFCKSV